MEEKKEIHAPVITESTAEEIENVFEDRERESEEKVEAALFIAGRFLEIQELIMLTDINPVMIKEILNRLEKKYSKRLIKIFDVHGKKTGAVTNKLLFFYYSDGTIEKKIILK